MTTEHIPRPSGIALHGFVLPRGVLGRIGGWLMGRGNGPAQEEVAALLDVRPGDRVLEVGYGPGTLLRLLAERSEGQLIAGVDPSLVMRDQALRRCRAGVASGQVEPDIGTAADTGHHDRSFDHVVSVNNLLFWDDLSAGFKEAYRVLRPGGALVVAFHSRSSPVRHERRMGLPEDVAVQTETALSVIFDEVTRHELRHVVAFTATRPGSP